MNMEMDDLDKRLLNIIQADFPLNREPFASLGLNLGITGSEIISRINTLKADGIIRLIGPVFNPRALGYRTTLVAARVPAAVLAEARRTIRGQAMVSHCYIRDHDFNLWFTVAMPTSDDIEAEVQKLGKLIKSEATINLPAVTTFKLEAYFDVSGGTSNLTLPAKRGRTASHPDIDSNLSATDRALINALPLDLPLTEKPFDPISVELQIDIEKFLGKCQSLLQRGIMKRYSASVNHNKLGLKANAMTCWKVPADLVDKAGKKIAIFREVSHCYERRADRLWPYNLFAMIHAPNNETCRAVTDKICSDAQLNGNEMVLLFSTEEIKKTRVRYTV
jgi:DNA-binding Lrp family transcriptional regulator